MIVISDATPLITLLKADELDILNKLFGEVLVPEAVYSEVTTNENFNNEAELIRNSDFIKVVKVDSINQVELLRRATGLDLGESEAIIYADESKADLLLIDEVAGRRVAQNMNLPVAGSIGILIKAFKAGLLTVKEADDAFYRIRNSNRHISEKLIDDALDIIRSRSSSENK